MRSFGQDLRLFLQKTMLEANQVVRMLGLTIWIGVVKRTPVDTGRARGNWRIGVNRIDPAVVPTGWQPPRGPKEPFRTPGPPAGQDLALAQAAIAEAKFGDTVNVSNNLPYIVPLEDGHSDQAPHGMVALTVQEVRMTLRSNVRELLKAEVA